MGLASNLPGPQELRSELQATLQVGAARGKEGLFAWTLTWPEHLALPSQPGGSSFSVSPLCCG